MLAFLISIQTSDILAGRGDGGGGGGGGGGEAKTILSELYYTSPSSFTYNIKLCMALHLENGLSNEQPE